MDALVTGILENHVEAQTGPNIRQFGQQNMSKKDSFESCSTSSK